MTKPKLPSARPTNVHIGAEIPEADRNWLHAEAKRQDRSVSWLIRQAIQLLREQSQ